MGSSLQKVYYTLVLWAISRWPSVDAGPEWYRPAGREGLYFDIIVRRRFLGVQVGVNFLPVMVKSKRHGFALQPKPEAGMSGKGGGLAMARVKGRLP